MVLYQYHGSKFLSSVLCISRYICISVRTSLPTTQSMYPIGTAAPVVQYPHHCGRVPLQIFRAVSPRRPPWRSLSGRLRLARAVRTRTVSAGSSDGERGSADRSGGVSVAGIARTINRRSGAVKWYAACSRDAAHRSSRGQASISVKITAEFSCRSVLKVNRGLDRISQVSQISCGRVLF